jgi:hypothetical protein
LRYLRAVIFSVAGLGFVDCGGGSTPPTANAPIAPQTMATSSTSVPAGGGTATVTLGKQTATVTVPAGAFASGATLKLTLTASTSLPVTFASKGRKAAQSIPTGSAPLAALAIDAGGATLLAPLQVGFSGAALATGTSAMVTGYNNASFNDVATTTYDGANFNTAVNTHYPGLTLASQTLYVLYSLPTANIATPASVVTVTGPASVSTASTGTYTAAEATANGFPFFSRTYAFSVDNANLGTIVTQTGGLTGVLTGGAVGATGNVVATDAVVSAFSGKLAVAATSSRPGAAGLTESYSGTLTEVDANNVINPSPSPSSTPISTITTAKATLKVSAATATDGSGHVIFTANESDASNLTTLTSQTVSTVAYQAQNSGNTNVRTLTSVATESSGVIYEHDYGSANGLLTVLPEVAGAFSNDAAEEYKETDPGIGTLSSPPPGSSAQGVTTDRRVASSGTYLADINETSYAFGNTATDVATENADFSGSLQLNSVDPTGNFNYTYSAPASGQINVSLIDPNFSINQLNSAYDWIPSQTTPSVETDSIAAVSQLDSSCTNTGAFATGSMMLVTQTLKIVDVVQGTFETRTTKSYDVNGLGTLCTVVADTIQTYYDYSNQEGGSLFTYSSAPGSILTTTINETLSLQSSNAAQVAGVTRTTQAVGTTFALLPRAVVANRVQYLVRQRQAERMLIFRNHAAQLVRGGSSK